MTINLENLCDLAFENISVFDKTLDSLSTEWELLTETDSSNAGTVLIAIEQSNLQSSKKIDLAKKFVSALDISKLDEKYHYAFLSGLANSRYQDMLQIGLDHGFDPGSKATETKDVFQVAVEQCQLMKEDNNQRFYKESQADHKHLSDIQMTEMMLRTGKVAGFEGRKGEIEADKIKNILDGNGLPQEYVESNFNVVDIAGENFLISKNQEGLTLKVALNANPTTLARVYLHQYYERTIPPRQNTELDQKIESREKNKPDPTPKPEPSNSSFWDLFTNCCRTNDNENER